MADDATPNPLPPAGQPVLDGNGNFTLPWRRAFQTTRQNASGGITQLTGDVLAGPGGGTQPASLSQTGVVPGSYLSTNITVDAKGRILAASDGSGGSGSSDLDPLALAAISLLDGYQTVQAAYKLARPRTFTYTGDAGGGPTTFDGSANVSTALTLATVNSNVGTFGDSTHVARITVNGKGLVTAVTNVAIAGGAGGASWFPLVDGAEPPGFITDGAGVLIAVAYAP